MRVPRHSTNETLFPKFIGSHFNHGDKPANNEQNLTFFFTLYFDWIILSKRIESHSQVECFVVYLLLSQDKFNLYLQSIFLLLLCLSLLMFLVFLRDVKLPNSYRKEIQHLCFWKDSLLIKVNLSAAAAVYTTSINKRARTHAHAHREKERVRAIERNMCRKDYTYT